ncbi:MAG: 6-bladed beta-propeller [Parabacteroides sp.]|nr:6-bladed beta-propeller [Parabacteroides sp.]
MKNLSLKVLILLVICLYTSCKEQIQEEKGNLVFKKEQSVTFEKVPFFKEKNMVSLEMNDTSLIAAYPALAVHKDYYLVYSKQSGGQILQFNREGKFLTKIGNLGSGPGDYMGLTDVQINPTDGSIEVLGQDAICQYISSGAFLKKIPHSYPAFSFCKEDEQTYWFYLGNNNLNGNNKVYKTDQTLNKVGGYLESNPKMLPLMEQNFHKGDDYLTFHEGFNTHLYRIQKHELVETYNVSLGNLAINLQDFPSDPMQLLPYLQKKNYANIQCYLENNQYIYLLIAEHVPNQKGNSIYHWFIQKETQKEFFIKQPEGITPDSYLYAPQVLTSENLLYFIGYPLESSETVSLGETNPSIIILDLSTVFGNN